MLVSAMSGCGTTYSHLSAVDLGAIESHGLRGCGWLAKGDCARATAFSIWAIVEDDSLDWCNCAAEVVLNTFHVSPSLRGSDSGGNAESENAGDEKW